MLQLILLSYNTKRIILNRLELDIALYSKSYCNVWFSNKCIHMSNKTKKGHIFLRSIYTYSLKLKLAGNEALRHPRDISEAQLRAPSRKKVRAYRNFEICPGSPTPLPLERFWLPITFGHLSPS